MANDPYRSYNFMLEIAGQKVGGFVSASGLGARVEVIEYREGGGGAATRNLPGKVSYDPLVLSYGVTLDHGFWGWISGIFSGTPDRRNVSIIQFQNDGMTEAFRWNLFDAWPSALCAGPMEAHSNTVAIENVTLVYDRMERD